MTWMNRMEMYLLCKWASACWKPKPGVCIRAAASLAPQSKTLPASRFLATVSCFWRPERVSISVRWSESNNSAASFSNCFCWRFILCVCACLCWSSSTGNQDKLNESKKKISISKINRDFSTNDFNWIYSLFEKYNEYLITCRYGSGKSTSFRQCSRISSKLLTVKFPKALQIWISRVKTRQLMFKKFAQIHKKLEYQGCCFRYWSRLMYFSLNFWARAGASSEWGWLLIAWDTNLSSDSSKHSSQYCLEKYGDSWIASSSFHKFQIPGLGVLSKVDYVRYVRGRLI